MEDILNKYNIRHGLDSHFTYQINYFDVCTKLLNIDIDDDELCIDEHEFIQLLLSKDNDAIDDVKKFYKEYNGLIEEIPDEIIKPLKGYETVYNISSYGYVISLRSGKILSQHFLAGYYAVDIKPVGGSEKDHKNLHVHVLMAETFLKKPIDVKIKYIVDHINGIKTDNRLENLRYYSYGNNNKNAYLTGNKKLSGCLEVCKLDAHGMVLETYNSINEAARKNKCDSGDIGKCCKGIKNTVGGYRWRLVKPKIIKDVILNDDEIFKPLPKIKGMKFSKYIVSNYGKIKNVENDAILSNRITCKGYELVSLYPDIGKRVTLNVNRLVAFTFLETPVNADILKVNHIDENPRNNYYKNLEWLTNRQNVVYSLGKPVEQIDIKTGKVIQTFDSVSAASRSMGLKVYSSNIITCCNGKTLTAYGYKWRFAKKLNNGKIVEV